MSAKPDQKESIDAGQTCVTMPLEDLRDLVRQLVKEEMRDLLLEQRRAAQLISRAVELKLGLSIK